MKAVIHMHNPHHRRYGRAIMQGLRRHGIEVVPGGHNQPQPCDFAILWGWKQTEVIRKARHVLLLEGTPFRQGDPMNVSVVSVGWDGLMGRGRYPKAPDGARWQRWAHLLQPWTERQGYALLIGQLEGDAAVKAIRVDRWAQATTDALRALGWEVVFRPHPRTDARRAPAGARLSRGTLPEDLAGAGVCVTYNSTTGVESVLAGVPTVTMDRGAWAWPMTTHDLAEPLIRPDRERWLWDLAWTSWSHDEIASGEAWVHLREVMEPC